MWRAGALRQIGNLRSRRERAAKCFDGPLRFDRKSAQYVVFVFVTPWIVKAITWLQGRLARRLLGAGR
jgi:hypothetical protein